MHSSDRPVHTACPFLITKLQDTSTRLRAHTRMFTFTPPQILCICMCCMCSGDQDHNLVNPCLVAVPLRRVDTRPPMFHACSVLHRGKYFGKAASVRQRAPPRSRRCVDVGNHSLWLSHVNHLKQLHLLREVCEQLKRPHPLCR